MASSPELSQRRGGGLDQSSCLPDCLQIHSQNRPPGSDREPQGCHSQRQLSRSGSSPPTPPFPVRCQILGGNEAENTVLSFGSREL